MQATQDFVEPLPLDISWTLNDERRPDMNLNKRQLDGMTTKDALANVRYVCKTGVNPE